LLDYVDFVVHVFSEKARKFYDLERLWKTAKRLEPGDLKPVPRKRRLESKPTVPKQKKIKLKTRIKTKMTKIKKAS